MAGILVVFAGVRDVRRAERQPDADAARCRSVDLDHAVRRQHGGQGGPLRRCRVRPVRRLATTGTSTGAVNCMHDSFTPLGGVAPMTAHDARRDLTGRRRRRPDGHPDHRPARRVHRRADGRTNARVPGQEDPGRRDEAGDAVHPGDAVRVDAVRRRVGGAEERGHLPGGRHTVCRRCSTTSPRRPTTTARRSPTKGRAPSGTRPPRASRC